MLAEVYWTILRYLSGAVRILTPDDQTAAGISPENWLEGSKDAIRVEIPELQNTEYELYKQLRAADGIRSFSTCYLMKDSRHVSVVAGPLCGWMWRNSGHYWKASTIRKDVTER